MPRQIQGSQWDFSYGEVDVALKRADNHPARKGGLRQMANARILNSGSLQNRSGRRALYPVTNAGERTERFTISPGNVFDIQFAAGRLKIIDSTGTTVGNFTLQGGGAALPWASNTDINSIVYAILGLSIYITFAGMRPQIVSWNGVSAWRIDDFVEQVIGNQKRTPFYRISPQDITLLPAAQTGAGVNVTASSPIFTAAHVGVRIRYVNRQMLITSLVGAPPTAQCLVTIQEPLPGSQSITFSTDPTFIFSVGDVVRGSVSGSAGIVTAATTSPAAITIQLISTNSSTTTTLNFSSPNFQQINVFAFIASDIIVGPGGSMSSAAIAPVIGPRAVAYWDEEVMNAFRGYPASCFVDQFRVGFCNFPAIPGGIGWSAINSPTDLYVAGSTSSSAMFEIAPAKVQVYYVVAGPEGSEFVFCDKGVFYIPISETNPLKPGSVAFKRLSGDGSARVHPRISQEAILYINAGQNSVMAVIATGAYLRPFNTKNLSDYHAHLFNAIQAIAAPAADGTFNERYAYVLNGDGSIAVGKYDPQSLPGNTPVIGWGPWSGTGAVSWISAHSADVLFTSSYFGTPVVEVLDDAQYLDCALAVNALPTAFTPPGGKGPLWFIPSQSVWLMDQVTRNMGTYQIDANGFIIPQFNGGEDLTLASLVAGQPWAMVAEPFAPDAQPGADVGQRMKKRQFSYFAAYVINSTGFAFETLFSSQQLPTSPALGTPMNRRDVPAYNAGEDATKPPKQRETAEFYAPQGSTFDPRAAIIKDTPGPLLIAEIAMEITI